MKVGRNDLCPCGSGKKYKKCCMGMEEARHREARSLGGGPEWVNFYARALQESVAGQINHHPSFQSLLASWPGAEEHKDQWSKDSQLLQHALFDVNADTKGPLILNGSAEARANASVEQLGMLAKCLSETHTTLLEVTECKRGKGVRLQDSLTQKDYFVSDPELSNSLEPMEVVLGRLTIWEGKAVLLSGWEKVYFRGRKAAIQELENLLISDGLEDDDADARTIWLRRQARVVVRRAREATPQ